MAGFWLGCDDDASKAGSGQIHVATLPEGADITCNGRMFNAAPVNIPDLNPGKHLIIARKEGYEEARRTVTLQPNQNVPVELKLKKTVGLVLVHSNPSEADVTVDNAFIAKTPLLISDFPLGTRRIKLQKDGFLDREVEISVNNRIPQEVNVDLLPDSARVTFQSIPSGATVLINGIERGETPLEIGNVPTGLTKVEYRKTGYHSWNDDLRLEAGDVKIMSQGLVAIPGVVRIETTPPGAKVYLNNQFKGESPVSLPELPAGDYLVRAEHIGYEISQQPVTVVADQEQAVRLTLVKNSGMIVVVTEPAGVMVYIDDKARGVTEGRESDLISDPLEIDLLAQGPHRLLFSKTGY
ncbi:MAG: PEGA domain-containing protein, partial [Verrucomicrobiota bacterium]